MLNKIIIVMFFILMQSGLVLCQSKFKTKQDCYDYWHYVISKDEIKKEIYFKYKNDTKYDINNEKNILCGIEYLLKMEGNKNNTPSGRALVWEATRMESDNQTIEIAALFKISEIVGLGNTIAYVKLFDDDRHVNPDTTMAKAYKYYREWFEKVKKIGLNKAREMKLDPLEDRDVHWVKMESYMHPTKVIIDDLIDDEKQNNTD